MAVPAPHKIELKDISPNFHRGLILCCFYLLLFAGFLLLTIFRPEPIARDTLEYNGLTLSVGGLSVAMMLALALIVLAVLLSLFYIRPGHSKKPKRAESPSATT